MIHVQGPDSRKWRITEGAACSNCGSAPIAARSGNGVGWNLQCINGCEYHFEQWLSKCLRKWNHFNSKISYAHKDNPTGERFTQYQKDQVPVWAVDVRPYQA